MLRPAAASREPQRSGAVGTGAEAVRGSRKLAASGHRPPEEESRAARPPCLRTSRPPRTCRTPNDRSRPRLPLFLHLTFDSPPSPLLSYYFQFCTFFCTLRLLDRTVKRVVVTPPRTDLPPSTTFFSCSPGTSDTSLEVLVEPSRAEPSRRRVSCTFGPDDTLNHEVRSSSTSSDWLCSTGMTLGDVCVHMLLCWFIILFCSIFFYFCRRRCCLLPVAAVSQAAGRRRCHGGRALVEWRTAAVLGGSLGRWASL